MNSISLPVVALSAALVLASGISAAALTSSTDAHVTFDASGPAGMKIEGTTSELTVTEEGGNVVITVPLANLSTGISLRDHHMREKYLEVPRFPTAVLTIARSGLKFPGAGEKAEADAHGTVTIHGQTKPAAVHYDVKGDGAGFAAHGLVHINMNDFGITVPVYLGVTVKPDVDVTATFHVAGT